MDTGKWIYKGKEEDLEDKLGFVYLITEKSTGRKYVGIKQMRKRIRRKPLKGQKRHRISYVESDWKNYSSSSEKLQALIDERGEDEFVFEILSAHQSKSRLKWEELKIQVENNVLENDLFFNQMVNVRLSKLGD